MLSSLARYVRTFLSHLTRPSEPVRTELSQWDLETLKTGQFSRPMGYWGIY